MAPVDALSLTFIERHESVYGSSESDLHVFSGFPALGTGAYAGQVPGAYGKTVGCSVSSSIRDPRGAAIQCDPQNTNKKALSLKAAQSNSYILQLHTWRQDNVAKQ